MGFPAITVENGNRKMLKCDNKSSIIGYSFPLQNAVLERCTLVHRHLVEAFVHLGFSTNDELNCLNSFVVTTRNNCEQ